MQDNKIIFTKLSSDTLIDVSNYRFTAIDAEWAWLVSKGFNSKGETIKGKVADYITVQFGFSRPDGKVELVVVFWNSKYPTPSVEDVQKLETTLGIQIKIVVTDRLDKENLLNYFKLPTTLETFMYYSPKDVQGMLGKEKWKAMLLEKVGGAYSLKKMRRLNVPEFKVLNDTSKCTINITDLIGMFSEKLDDALKSVGIDNPYKSLAEEGGQNLQVKE